MKCRKRGLPSVACPKKHSRGMTKDVRRVIVPKEGMVVRLGEDRMGCTFRRAAPTTGLGNPRGKV